MRNTLLISVSFFIILFLSACIGMPEADLLDDPSPRQELHKQNNGLELSVSGTELHRPIDHIPININNDDEELYEYGEFFYIEKKMNNEWYMLAFDDSIFSDFGEFTNFGTFIKPDLMKKHIIEPKDYQLTLDDGDYRFVKAFRNAYNNQVIWLADEFIVQ